MTFTYLTNIPLDEARTKYLEALQQAGLKRQTEVIQTVEARNRISSKAVYAQISAPHYNACAMDGIALKGKLTANASEINPAKLLEKDYVWVNTGDPLPEGCDCVVMAEDVIQDGEWVLLHNPASAWQHVRQIGEDISAGDMVVPSYSIIDSPTQGALLAAGVLELEVFSQPLAAIIPSGNELVPPSTNPGPGDIIEFNSTIFSGLMEECGFKTKVYPIVPDEEESIKGVLAKAVDECDFVLLNAGSSAGKKDYSAKAIASIGELILHGVAIKPGKPAILGMSKANGKVVPVVGLPGYPVSGILVLSHLLKPVTEFLTGRYAEESTVVEAQISRRLNSSLKYLEFIRASVGEIQGKTVTIPLNRGAGVVSSFVKADGIIEVPQNVENYDSGEKVPVRLLRPLSQIRRSVIVTGSHDPLIDEVTDLLRQKDPRSRVSSSHVGSMGAIMAIKRKEAHLGGIHLLDEASGSYNIPYLRRYFPDGGVRLVSVVLRSQGLLVAPGNPLGIQGIKDIAGFRYVNRQKGSGTRILADFLTKQQDIDTAEVEGYQREEFTHTAVAAAIAAGTADTGLAIYSVAKIYGLDFIPIANEEYSLLVDEESMHLEEVQKFLEILKTPEFAERLLNLGGYTLQRPGEILEWN